MSSVQKVKSFFSSWQGKLAIFCLLVLWVLVSQILLSSGNRTRSNDRSAKTTMQVLFNAQIRFKNTQGKGNFTAELAQLAEEQDLIPPPIARMQIQPFHGFLLGKIQVSPKSAQIDAKFSVVAFPAIGTGLNRTGNDCFYIDETGILRHSGSPTKIPDVNSPPVE